MISFSFGINSFAQSVVSSTGGHFQNKEYQLRSTMGEATITSLEKGDVLLTEFQNRIPGQKITIINKGTSPIVLTSFSGSQWIFNPGFVSYTLNQYESASYVFNNN